MDVLERLLKVHRPIGIYNIKEGSNIYNELSVYGAELERLEEEFNDLLNESFVPTASDWGLSRTEQIFGAVRDDLDVNLRRSMILSRYSLGNRDFTPDSVEKILKTAGVNGKTEEYPAQFRLVVHIEGEHPSERRKWITSQLLSLLPAHLEISPVFEGFSFGDSDSLGLSFREIDEKNMSWAQIDIYCKK